MVERSADYESRVLLMNVTAPWMRLFPRAPLPSKLMRKGLMSPRIL